MTSSAYLARSASSSPRSSRRSIVASWRTVRRALRERGRRVSDRLERDGRCADRSRGEEDAPKAHVLVGVVEDPDEEHVEDLGEALDRLADRVVGRVEQSAHEVGEEAGEGQARHLLRQRALVEESRERLHEVLAEPQLRRRRVGAKVGEAELEAGRDGVDEGVDVQEDVLRVLGDLAQDELEDVGAGGAVVRLERVDERRQVRHGLGHKVVLGERCRRARRRS